MSPASLDHSLKTQPTEFTAVLCKTEELPSWLAGNESINLSSFFQMEILHQGNRWCYTDAIGHGCSHLEMRVESLGGLNAKETKTNTILSQRQIYRHKLLYFQLRVTTFKRKILIALTGVQTFSEHSEKLQPCL